jgi:hypothetical protein
MHKKKWNHGGSKQCADQAVGRKSTIWLGRLMEHSSSPEAWTMSQGYTALQTVSHGRHACSRTWTHEMQVLPSAKSPSTTTTCKVWPGILTTSTSQRSRRIDQSTFTHLRRKTASSVFRNTTRSPKWTSQLVASPQIARHPQILDSETTGLPLFRMAAMRLARLLPRLLVHHNRLHFP